MKKLINFSTDIFDTKRYSNNADLKKFFGDLGFDGLELMRVGDDVNGIVCRDDVVGVHLRFFTTWMDLWTGNERRLLREFGDYSAVKEFYGGTTREALTQAFADNVTEQAEASPEYFVFHVSECQLVESILKKYHYNSEAVIDAAIGLVDSFSDVIRNLSVSSGGRTNAGKNSLPLLLFENLWYPGMNMLEPDLTFRLLEKVKYPNTGVMFDIGHLLHTNTALRTLDEAVDFVHGVLDLYEDLSFIKGAHLHQALNGAYSEELTRSWTPPEGNYRERSLAALSHIFNIDAHQPFLSCRVNEIIDRIQPGYLVIEQISSDRLEHARNLKAQLRYLK
ncbi:MAG TPA: hypothetical protein DEQ14_00765 [Treponema sp.]|nr:hypothetical protein [Treponema sp.]